MAGFGAVHAQLSVHGVETDGTAVVTYTGQTSWGSLFNGRKGWRDLLESVDFKAATWNCRLHRSMLCHRFMARFTVLKTKNSNMVFGVVADSWDAGSQLNPHRVQGHCMYDVRSGGRWPEVPGAWQPAAWDGMQGAGAGDRIGLLLDLAAGSMEVYKNEERLGAMQAGGLGNGLHFRWAVGLMDEGDAV
jgi:hypothetical protein